MASGRAILAVALMALGCSAQKVTVSPALAKVDTILQKLADANLFAGMAIAVKGGKEELLYKAYGQLMPELGVKMRPNMRYVIGSLGKGMTGAVMHILQAKGLLNTNDTIDKYIKAKDFGVATFCPRIYNTSATGPCIYPKIHELLSHQSGLVDVALHCRYPYGTWQNSACWSGPTGDPMILKYGMRLTAGAVPTKELVKNSGLFTLPLLWLPGTTYDDNNNNFVICAYIAELVTGMVWNDIYKMYLFDKAGLQNTFIDLAQGNDGVYKNMVPTPGYVSYISPLSLSTPGFDFEAIGNKTMTAGDVGVFSRNPEGPPYGTYVKSARLMDPVFGAMGMNVMHAGGAMVSSLRDLARYFNTLFRQPNNIGLTTAQVKSLLTTGTPYHSAFFAQGLVTRPNVSLMLGTPFAFYAAQFGYGAWSYTELDPTDPSKDVHVSVVTYRTPYSNFLRFAYNTSNKAPVDSSTDPLNPYNGNQVCLMSIKEDPTWYDPIYGANGGLPARSKASFDYFMAKAKASGSPLGNGQSVPAPHFYCEASFAQLGLPMYIGKATVEAALGRPWSFT